MQAIAASFGLAWMLLVSPVHTADPSVQSIQSIKTVQVAHQEELSSFDVSPTLMEEFSFMDPDPSYGESQTALQTGVYEVGQNALVVPFGEKYYARVLGDTNGMLVYNRTDGRLQFITVDIENTMGIYRFYYDYPTGKLMEIREMME